MKRLIIVTAVIALLAVAVFGGQALAAKPTGSSISIETDEDSINVSNCDVTIPFDYPQVRHVSLTVSFVWLIAPDYAEIRLRMPDGTVRTIEFIDSNKFHTYEFDSDNFTIFIFAMGVEPTTVSYYVTTTYER